MKDIIKLKNISNDLVNLINQEIVKFAERNPKIEAVCFGEMPESFGSSGTYIFIIKPPFDEVFENELTDLDIAFACGEIIKGTSINLDVICLPFGYSHKDNFPICIYDNPFA